MLSLREINISRDTKKYRLNVEANSERSIAGILQLKQDFYFIKNFEMMKGYRKKSLDSITRPFLLSYNRAQNIEERGVSNGLGKHSSDEVYSVKMPHSRVAPRGDDISNKKAKYHNLPHYYHRQEASNEASDYSRGRRNSEYLTLACRDQENRRPTSRRLSRNVTDFRINSTPSPVRHRTDGENRSPFLHPLNQQSRNLGDYSDQSIHSPVEYRQRYSISPTYFELKPESPAPSRALTPCTPFHLPHPTYHTIRNHDDDYGFTDNNSKIHAGAALRRESSSRPPSVTPSCKRSPAVQSSVSGTLSRSVARVMKRRKHVVLLGLDGSGKTTILMRLKFNAKFDTSPTVGFNHEKIWAGGFRWSAWDVGGGERVRSLWGTYIRGTDGVVFIVDASANSDTMEEARLELARIMKLAKTIAMETSRTPPPLLVMANFQDRKHARTAPAIAKCLSLPVEGETPPPSAVPASCWAVACVCALTGDGLDEAFATLRHLIDNGAQPAKRRKISPDWWR